MCKPSGMHLFMHRALRQRKTESISRADKELGISINFPCLDDVKWERWKRHQNMIHWCGNWRQKILVTKWSNWKFMCINKWNILVDECRALSNLKCKVFITLFHQHQHYYQYSLRGGESSEDWINTLQYKTKQKERHQQLMRKIFFSQWPRRLARSSLCECYEVHKRNVLWRYTKPVCFPRHILPLWLLDMCKLHFILLTLSGDVDLITFTWVKTCSLLRACFKFQCLVLHNVSKCLYWISSLGKKMYIKVMQTSTTPSNTKIMHSISPFINNLDQIDLTRKIIVIFLSKTISLFDSTKHPFLQKNLPW